jgi:hypothetical protein
MMIAALVILALGIIALGAAVAVVFRGQRQPRHARLVDVANEARARGDADGRAIRDAQARWLRDRERITADSVLEAVQGIRTTIVHAGAVEARAVLDDLEQLAKDHPQGVPGHLIADARLQFDECMRRNIQ